MCAAWSCARLFKDGPTCTMTHNQLSDVWKIYTSTITRYNIIYSCFYVIKYYKHSLWSVEINSSDEILTDTYNGHAPLLRQTATPFSLSLRNHKRLDSFIGIDWQRPNLFLLRLTDVGHTSLTKIDWQRQRFSHQNWHKDQGFFQQITD